MFYLLGGRSWASHPARQIEHSSISRGDCWWDDGIHFDNPPTKVIQACLKPYDDHIADMSSEIPEAYYKCKVPLFRDDLIKALNECGVTNMDCYPAEISDPDNGEIYRNFKAVNIIGMHSVADFKSSLATIHDSPIIDVSFDQLVLDPFKLAKINLLMFRLEENNGATLVHESVKVGLEAHGFKLAFYELNEAAI